MRPARRLGVVLSGAFLATCALAADYDPPRTSDGRPSFEGVWTNASLTTLARPAQIPNLVLTPEEAETLARGNFHNVRAAKDLLPRDPNEGPPEVLERLPPVGNYNAGWVEPGTRYAAVKGEIRSSWIVDPADGRIPFLPAIEEARRNRYRDRRLPEGPESLSLGERCLLGFGGTGGPPMLNVLYNNYYRIVQTSDHVVFLVEMVHDARIVRLDSEPGPADNRKWLGDSTGHWEGDTLVIETTSFHPERARNSPLPYSGDAKVVERLSRVSDEALLYEFTVEDPAYYSRPFRGEMSFRRVGDKLFEYACHEGNYALGNILKGARLAERDSEGTLDAP